MALLCGEGPDHSTIAGFIRKLGQHIETVFVDVLTACHEEGLLEGTELLADANYHSEPNLESCAENQLDAVIPDPNYRDRDEGYAGREKHIRKARPQKHKRFTKDDFDHDPKGQKLLSQNGINITCGGKGKFKKYAIGISTSTLINIGNNDNDSK